MKRTTAIGVGMVVLAMVVTNHVIAQQAPSSAAPLWAAFDADKDNAVTRAEMKSAFDAWYDAADTAKAGSISLEQLAAALNTTIPQPPPATPGAGAGRGRGGAAPQGAPCGGRGNLPTTGQTACPDDVTKMVAALPATA